MHWKFYSQREWKINSQVCHRVGNDQCGPFWMKQSELGSSFLCCDIQNAQKGSISFRSFSSGPIHTGRAMRRKQMRPVDVNGGIHTARKQHQRKNFWICARVASRVLCGLGLHLVAILIKSPAAGSEFLKLSRMFTNFAKTHLPRVWTGQKFTFGEFNHSQAPQQNLRIVGPQLGFVCLNFFPQYFLHTGDRKEALAQSSAQSPGVETAEKLEVQDCVSTENEETETPAEETDKQSTTGDNTTANQQCKFPAKAVNSWSVSTNKPGSVVLCEAVGNRMRQKALFSGQKFHHL